MFAWVRPRWRATPGPVSDSAVHKQTSTPWPRPAPPVPNTPPTSCPPLEPLTFPPLRSRGPLPSAAPHVAGPINGLRVRVMMSPLMSMQLPRPLNGKNKRGILDIRAIVWAATHGCPACRGQRTTIQPASYPAQRFGRWLHWCVRMFWLFFFYFFF